LAGNAIAVWSQNEGPDRAIKAGIRPPGGSFSALGKVSPSSGSAVSPTLAVNPGGAATVAWRFSGSGGSVVQTATRPPGGAFSSPLSVSNGKDNPFFPEVALNGAGSAAVVWSGDNGISDKIVRGVVRPAGGSFGAPVAISQSSPDPFHPHVAMDLAGDATVVWFRSNGLHKITQEAGYDGSPPELRDVSIPSSATVGESLQFSASGVDEWPIGPPHFSFGDGGAADGSPASHAYSAPGAYLVTITDTDAGGMTATVTGTTHVKARNKFTIGKLLRKRGKGTATLEVTVPEPGSVVVSGKGIKRATARAARGGTVKLPLKAVGKGLKQLNEDGKLKAKLKVAYSPVGGDTNSVRYAVTLLKKLG
jgi:PKD domain